MARWIAVVGGIVFLALSYEVAAQFPVLRLYDTFDSQTIDPARWFITGSTPIYEIAVYQRGGKLNVESSGYGGMETNIGLAETGRIRVGVLRDTALALNAIEVTTRINSAEVTDCEANGADGRSTVRLAAALFNNGDDSNSGGFDRRGDILAYVNIHIRPNPYSPIGPFQVQYSAVRCTDGNCSDFETFGFGQFTRLVLTRRLPRGSNGKWQPARSFSARPITRPGWWIRPACRLRIS